MPKGVETFARAQRPLKMSRNRFSHEFLGLTDRLLEGEPFGKTSRDRRRIRAAGAMSCNAAHERRREFDNFPVAK